MSPRKYESSRRQAAAEATRVRILEAARSILASEADVRNFSMEAVAARAGVARMTVYYQFRSRAELLAALADHLAARGGMQRMREVFLEPDPEKAIRKLVATFVQFWATDRLAMRRLRAMGVVSPSLYGHPRGRDDWRREAVANLLARWEGPARGTGGSARKGRIDLLTTLTSFETFDALCADDRSPKEVADLLADAALAGLANPRPTPTSRR